MKYALMAVVAALVFVNIEFPQWNWAVDFIGIPVVTGTVAGLLLELHEHNRRIRTRDPNYGWHLLVGLLGAIVFSYGIWQSANDGVKDLPPFAFGIACAMLYAAAAMLAFYVSSRKHHQQGAITIQMYWAALISLALLLGAAGLYWKEQAWWLWFLGASPIVGSLVGHAVHKNEEECARNKTGNNGLSEFYVVCLLLVAVIVGAIMFAANAEVHWFLMGLAGLILAVLFAALPVLGPVTILAQTWDKS